MTDEIKDMMKEVSKKADQQYEKYVLAYDSPTCLRWFLFVNLLPAILQPLVHEKAGGKPKLFADHNGKRVRVVMASRFGDVGITGDLTKEHGYQHRVFVDDLTNFSEEP